MKQVLKTSTLIICLLVVSCKDQPKNTNTQSAQSSTPSSAQSSTPSAPKDNPNFSITNARYEEGLAVKSNMGNINVGNLDTGYPFVVIELVLKTDEAKFKSSDIKLTDPAGKQYKLDGYAPFAIEDYKPLPPEKGTIFDVFPLNQKDSTGSTVQVNWSKDGKDIEFGVKGKGAKIILTFAAPKAEGEYKLTLPASDPIAFKPQAQSQ